jgi:hypothetical protein
MVVILTIVNIKQSFFSLVNRDTIPLLPNSSSICPLDSTYHLLKILNINISLSCIDSLWHLGTLKYLQDSQLPYEKRYYWNIQWKARCLTSWQHFIELTPPFFFKCSSIGLSDSSYYSSYFSGHCEFLWKFFLYTGIKCFVFLNFRISCALTLYYFNF